MSLPSIEDLVVADVKCYYCGHISGQIAGLRGSSIRAGRFIPRPGYKGPEVTSNSRLRCERCKGPVFLEDATPMARAEGALAETLGVKPVERKKRQRAA